jgi:hypothetical protein
MTLEITRLLFDVSLFVLIWITQLVVYPGFKYYKRDNLIAWHNKYAHRVSFMTLPLMLGQLTITGIQLWTLTSSYAVISFAIIVLLWAATFLHFVPIHNKISKGNYTIETLSGLEKRNWVRTILWTILFIASLVCIMN